MALFFGLPLLITYVHPMVAVAMVLSALLYCVWLAKAVLKISRSELSTPAPKEAWKWVIIRFVAFAIASTVYVYLSAPSDLFAVVIHAPLMWLGICVLYTLVSAIPQELIYRLFFFKRYADLFANRKYLVIINASVFCLAHLMFNSIFVLVITFLGGLLFANTYKQSHSFGLVCAEHIAYGLWLYTVGLGAMLAFPMP